jgi:anti-anti-sigma factor
VTGEGISIERGDDGVVVVVLAGEHETYGADRLERELDALVEEGVAVVVDLSPATFVDSATLLALLRARKKAEEAGVGFVLEMDSSTGTYVLRTFEIARLTTIFVTADSRPEAIRLALAGGPAPQPGAETA